ncbi:MAG: hypothetical protein HRU44_04740, partial [Candidatus Thalassarchaeum sp.]|nr:hypothetical protein [Candidatus Thalassarchaeum sp.]
MQDHFLDPEVFIRSLSTRGSHGGLARAGRDVARIFGAYGKDVVIIETVGVGQTELDIMRRRDHIGRDEDDSEGTQRGHLRTVVRVDCAEHRQQHTQRGEGGSAGEGGDGQLHLKTHRCHLRGAVSAHSQRSAAPSR